MLSVRQCYLSLLGLQVAAVFGLLPIAVQVTLGKIQIHPSKWRQRVWKTWVILLSCRTIQMLGLGTEMWWNPESIYLAHLPLFSSVLIGSLISILGMFLLFIRCPDLTVAIFNELLVQRVVGPAGRLTVYGKLSLTLPFQVIAASMLITLAVIMNPEAVYPLFFPSCAFWRTQWAFLCFIGLFMGGSLFTLTYIGFSAFMILIFLQNCKEWNSQRTEELKKKTWTCTASIYSICIQCRQLQLLMQMFNQAFAYYIFALKISAIAACVVLFSFGVHLFHLHPEAVMYILLGMDIVASFPLLFDKGFAISVQNEQLNRLIRSRCGKASNSRFLLKTVKSLRNVGIKVGSFHQLERMSTLNFLGFVAVNVSRTLIALKKR